MGLRVGEAMLVRKASSCVDFEQETLHASRRGGRQQEVQSTESRSEVTQSRRDEEDSLCLAYKHHRLDGLCSDYYRVPAPLAWSARAVRGLDSATLRRLSLVLQRQR